MLEPSVCAEFLEVNGIPRISVFLQITLETQIHAHGLRMAFGRQLGVDLKNSVLVRHARGDILRRDSGAGALHGADGIVYEFRPQLAVNGHIIGDNVAHAGQLSDDSDLHPPQRACRVRRRAEIRCKGCKLAVFAAAREECAGDAGPHQAVGVVL